MVSIPSFFLLGLAKALKARFNDLDDGSTTNIILLVFINKSFLCDHRHKILSQGNNSPIDVAYFPVTNM